MTAEALPNTCAAWLIMLHGAKKHDRAELGRFVDITESERRWLLIDPDKAFATDPKNAMAICLRLLEKLELAAMDQGRRSVAKKGYSPVLHGAMNALIAIERNIAIWTECKLQNVPRPREKGP